MVTELLQETQELFDIKTEFTCSEMPDVLLADEMRLKYILQTLIQKASTRNKLNTNFRSRCPVLVNTHLAEDQ